MLPNFVIDKYASWAEKSLHNHNMGHQMLRFRDCESCSAEFC
jgi:hypothetical protein